MGQFPSTPASEVMEEPVPKRRKVVATSAAPAPDRTHSRPIQSLRPGSPRETEAARTVRPRPLHVNEKIKVLWQGRSPEWDEMDGGAFAKWMQACEEEESQQRQIAAALGVKAAASIASDSSQALSGLRPQVVVVGHNSKPLAHDPRAEAADLVRSASGLGAAAGPINVPKCRRLPKAKYKKKGGKAAAPSPTSIEERYVRHVDSAASGAEQRIEYDMDDEDEAWLTKYNKQRLLSSSRGPRLSEDAFEGVIDSFEKGLHHALEQRTELWPSVIEASTAAPDIESILPPEEACELPGLKHLSTPAVRAAYSHWCSKRLKAKRPLLQRLWFEQPWVRVREASKEHCGAPGSPRELETELPFMGIDVPRPSTRPRWIDADEAMLKLLAIRGDLEVIRTMADQVHRREKQMRRELLQWREDWRGVLSMDPAEALENLPDGPAKHTSADRESRLANRAAMQAAREASTLVGAQVSMAALDGEDAEMPPAPYIARTASLNGASAQPMAAPEGNMACFWCLGSGSLVACNHCPRCFCYNCYKSRHSYGIINWAKVLKEPNFHCPVCTGKEPASNEGDSVPGAERPSATAGRKAASSRWQVGWSFLRGRGRRGRGRGSACSSADREAQAPDLGPPGMARDPEDLECLAPGQQETAKDKVPQKRKLETGAAAQAGGRSMPKAGPGSRPAAEPRTRVTRASVGSFTAAIKQEADVRPSAAADAPVSRKKRATEAAKLVESARRWEKVDGSLGPTRGRGSAQPADAACPQAGPGSVKLELKEPEEQHVEEMEAPSSARRIKSQQCDANSAKVSDREAGPEDVGIEGIERVKRKVQSAAQRILRTEYLCTCREHGAYRMDRVSRMASFFAQHSGCMPAWAALAQQPGESSPACDERLRKMFSFSADSAGSIISLSKAVAPPKPALKPSVRSAAPKRKPGMTAVILAEVQLPDNYGRSCNSRVKQLAALKPKTAADAEDLTPLPACQQHAVAAKGEARGLAARLKHRDLNSLPARKESIRPTRGRAGPVNGIRMLRHTGKGS